MLENSAGDGVYTPSALLVPGTGGHADVVRCMYHATADQALYTGSEDGVLAGWSLASLALNTGADEHEDDGGMEVDGEEEERERGRERDERRSKKEKRREKRHAPY